MTPTQPTRSLLQGMPYVRSEHTNLRERFKQIRAEAEQAKKQTQNVKQLRRK